VDPKKLVAASYDRLADRHAAWASRIRTAERRRYADLIVERLPDKSKVLELGCGAGVPTTRALAHRLDVTGVDVSRRQLDLARRNVPTARFVCADMTRLAWRPESFDAVAAFYSIIHVPRDEHLQLFQDIVRWLRPGGLFVGTLGLSDTPAGHEADWLGVPMFWSSYDLETSQRQITSAGLTIERATVETADEDGDAVSFLWVVATRQTGMNRS
jgi:SAM-dependent methyltransferase